MKIKSTCARRWVRAGLTSLIAVSGLAVAAEPPYIYKDFGYSPVGTEFGQFSESQKATLDSCIALAKETESSARNNSSRLEAIYGAQVQKIDYFGVYLTGCLSDKNSGKGWSVYKKMDNDWQAVTDRYAERTFMQLDPDK